MEVEVAFEFLGLAFHYSKKFSSLLLVTAIVLIVSASPALCLGTSGSKYALL
jgi:hypothetical protein